MKPLLIVSVAIAIVLALAASQAPSVAAGGLLHPARRQPRATAPANCVDREFAGNGVALHGLHCRATLPKRGTVVYLHGIADNRDSSIGVVRRFTAQGLDVVAYDSRAHGASEGNLCTYGYYEKEDLRRVIDTISPGPLVLMGTSLGAAVALQEAATDDRVFGVIAAEVFSDLETIARERAPSFFPGPLIAEAFRIVEQRGAFAVRDVSPVRAATTIRVPVLLIHGEDDVLTRPDHSRRVFAALAGRKRLLLVPGAGHNESLRHPTVWSEVERWLDDVVQHARTRASRTSRPILGSPFFA
jgi:pimeloyl-ACP methyl ester carboxylesterase